MTPGMFCLLGDVLRKALHATQHVRAFPEEVLKRGTFPTDVESNGAFLDFT